MDILMNHVTPTEMISINLTADGPGNNKNRLNFLIIWLLPCGIAHLKLKI